MNKATSPTRIPDPRWHNAQLVLEVFGKGLGVKEFLAAAHAEGFADLTAEDIQYVCLVDKGRVAGMHGGRATKLAPDPVASLRAILRASRRRSSGVDEFGVAWWADGSGEREY